MSPVLHSKVAVVTGGSRGAGRAIVQRLLLEGASVISVSRSAPSSSDDERLLSLAADVSRPEDAQRVCDAARQYFGRLDVLVNNAAVIHDGSVEDTDAETWDEVMAVNARGPFLCAKYAIPYLREAGGGAIINISSVNADWAQPDLAAYCASKGAVLALTRALAIDHARDGIRATCVCPGYIRTEMLEKYYENQEEPALARAAGGAMHPLGRVAEPEEVAGLVAWLASDDAGYITGHPVFIDGGLLAGQARLRPPGSAAERGLHDS